jgi:hypothetical protein
MSEIDRTKASREANSIRRIFIPFFLVIIAIAIITPHIFKGHIFGSLLVTEDYEQSLVILADGGVAYLLYRIYRNKMNKLLHKQYEMEKHLSRSYAHIGKINSKLELVENFIALAPVLNVGKKGEKELFSSLLSYMLVSVAKTRNGFVRFINMETGKTVNEYHLSGQKRNFKVKLPNIFCSRGISCDVREKNAEIVESFYRESPVRCVLCFQKGSEIYDSSLLQLLLTHMHLLFLASRNVAVA